MIKRFLIFLLIVVAGLFFIPYVTQFGTQDKLPALAKDYVNQGMDDVGSANLVTAVVVTFRGLDTLGEVSVLFIATAGVGFLMRVQEDKNKKRKKRVSSELLQTGSTFLTPLIFLFGVYIFIHGHLTPGGGFQGGVVIASGVLLMLLADVSAVINHGLLNITESFSGAFYVAIGVLGLVLAAGFLDNRFLPIGDLGRLFSAGAIPVIYSFVGLKVGAELTGIITTLNKQE